MRLTTVATIGWSLPHRGGLCAYLPVPAEEPHRRRLHPAAVAHGVPQKAICVVARKLRTTAPMVPAMSATAQLAACADNGADRLRRGFPAGRAILLQEARVLTDFENADFHDVRSDLKLDLVPDPCVEKRLAKRGMNAQFARIGIIPVGDQGE